jgi:predicted nucleic acid-binding protein
MSNSHSGGYLIDTNVISEGRRKRPDPRVMAFMRLLEGRDAFISVLALGELRKGLELTRRRDRRAAARLERWVDGVATEYADRTLSVDRDVAEVWGRLEAVRLRSTVDALIAATALVHGLRVVTRNVDDFADIEVPLINPWEKPEQ